MKRMTYLLPALLAVGIFSCTGAMAQERTANGAQDVQSTWAALKSLAASAVAKADAAEGKITALTTRITGLEGRVGSIETRVATTEGLVTEHTGRLDNIDTTLISIDGDISDLNAELSQLREDYAVLNWQVSKVIQCSTTKRFFNGVSKCKGDSGDVDVNPIVKNYVTLNVGDNDCNGDKCHGTGPTGSKVCRMRGYADMKGKPAVAVYGHQCGETRTAFRWSEGKGEWDRVKIGWTMIGGKCYGNRPYTAVIKQVTCYKID